MQKGRDLQRTLEQSMDMIINIMESTRNDVVRACSKEQASIIAIESTMKCQK